MKIINITHSDLDGAVCGILVKEYARQKGIPCDTIKARYDTVDKIFSELYKGNSKDFYIITDISLPNESPFIGNVNNILLIDHHSGIENSNIKHKKIDSSEGTSACKLVYDYFTEKSIVYDSKFTKLMELGHDYDSWTHKFKSSKALNYIYFLYYFERFVDRFENGFDGFTKDELLFLKCKMEQIKNILTNLEVSVINDDIAFVVEEDNINEIAEELRINRGFKYVFIYSQKRKTLSMRSSSDAIIHCGEFLQLLGGGGHKCTGGVIVKNENTIKEVLDAFEVVYDEYHPPF